MRSIRKLLFLLLVVVVIPVCQLLCGLPSAAALAGSAQDGSGGTGGVRRRRHHHRLLEAEDCDQNITVLDYSIEDREENLTLNECRSIEFELEQVSRTVRVFYTDDEVDVDRVDKVLNWVKLLWTILQDFNDPQDSTDFSVAIHYVPGRRSACCRSLADGGGMSLDATLLKEDLPTSLDRLTHDFWQAINFGFTSGDWLNEGTAVLASYLALRLLAFPALPFGILTEPAIKTSEYASAVDYFFREGYRTSLFSLGAAAAPFWQYIGQFGGDDTDTELLELQLQLWEDGLTGQDVTGKIENTIGSDFATIFADFTTANYANGIASFAEGLEIKETFKYKDWNIPNTAKPYPLPLLQPDKNISLQGTNTVENVENQNVPPWSCHYAKINLSGNPRFIQISFRQLGRFPAIFTFLFLEDDELVEYFREEEKQSFEFSFVNENAYDQIVLIITSLSYELNFGYTISDIAPKLIIDEPSRLTAVGTADRPRLFFVRFRFLNEEEGPLELVGMEKDNLSITVESETVTNVVVFSKIDSEYTLVLEAPNQTSSVTGTTVNLQIDVNGISDTKESILLYKLRAQSSTMLVIDNSASMSLNGKLQATKIATSVFIDSQQSGDQIGVISYNDNAFVNAPLSSWTTNRDLCLNQIDSLSPTGAQSVIGDALMLAINQFKLPDDLEAKLSIVLLSDNLSEDGELADFKTYWEDPDNDVRPEIYTVGLGDPGESRPDLVYLSKVTDGDFHYLDASSMLVGELTTTLRSVDESISGKSRLFLEEGRKFPCPAEVEIRLDVLVDDEMSSDVDFYFAWANATEVKVTLQDPSGTSVGPPHVNGTNYYIWTIPDAASGQWTVIVDPDSELSCDDSSFVLEVSGFSDLYFGIFNGPTREKVPFGFPYRINAFLADNTAAITGQQVEARVEYPNGNETTIKLLDDGNNFDGEIADGVYGNSILPLYDGAYRVRVTAKGSGFERSADSGFQVNTTYNDTDKDGIADFFEDDHNGCLIREVNDSYKDYDLDGFTNFDEWVHRTDPCSSNTDYGDGESDESEALNEGTDPKNKFDDVAKSPRHLDGFNDKNKLDLKFKTCREVPKEIYLDYEPRSPENSKLNKTYVWRNTRPTADDVPFEDNWRKLNDDTSNYDDTDFEPTGNFTDKHIASTFENVIHCYQLQSEDDNGRKSDILGNNKENTVSCAYPSRPFCFKGATRGPWTHGQKAVYVSLEFEVFNVRRMRNSTNKAELSETKWERDLPWTNNKETVPFTIPNNMIGNEWCAYYEIKGFSSGERYEGHKCYEVPQKSECKPFFFGGWMHKKEDGDCKEKCALTIFGKLFWSILFDYKEGECLEP